MSAHHEIASEDHTEKLRSSGSLDTNVVVYANKSDLGSKLTQFVVANNGSKSVQVILNEVVIATISPGASTVTIDLASGDRQSYSLVPYHGKLAIKGLNYRIVNA